MRATVQLKAVLILLTILFTSIPMYAQKEFTTLGIEVKPMLPSGLFDNQSLTNTDSFGTFSLQPKAGFGFGGVLRQSLFGRFALETGINYTKRSYHLSFSNDSVLSQDTFHFISYEIPILGLIYVPMSDYTYMNAAFGLSLDFFPNDIATTNGNLKMLSLRNYWVLPGLMANAGTEFRTKESGIFYIGISYHRMLARMADTRIEYHVNDIKQAGWTTPVSGHYFSVNFKYFLPTQRTEPSIRRF